jgi:hypothetical protein
MQHAPGGEGRPRLRFLGRLIPWEAAFGHYRKRVASYGNWRVNETYTGDGVLDRGEHASASDRRGWHR